MPAEASQGALVVGRATPGTDVRIDGRALRVAPDGSFVFGVPRDASAAVVVEAVPPAGPRQKREILLGLRQRLENHCAEHPESAEDLEATFGTPQDVTLQELRIEAFFPADDATRTALTS